MTILRRVDQWGVAACCLVLAGAFAGPGAAEGDEAPAEQKERTRYDDKLAGEKALIEGNEEKAERLLKQAARGVRETRDWRLDYSVNLARASRRLVENGQYERAVKIAQLVVDDLDAVLAENERAGSDKSAVLRARSLYWQGYLYERVFFDPDEAFRKYRQAWRTRELRATLERALEKLPSGVKERVEEQERRQSDEGTQQ